ncbi:glycoside hydrolase family 38 N-terminal domain-containing protein [Paenibacillus koleovorans]|uniref:glycoside hydrolase family 38 N-terminal domain-containing protein n=1 Tax=Paenibacillus koleovorans TaxID=121608 RepID=UPI000FD8EF5D|nr:alpha-mannosidase [Paenibacillus koleovorans]
MSKKLHLICNAHLDPAWLWEIEEGAGEALSTFRIAAEFCEEFDGFVFNHNEVILYQWIEEYDPALFARIQRLVREDKWHIMGGWYLQPDCNLPSGESFVRQMLAGRRYFAEKFGVRPTTAINFDPFGHTRGLVQLMAKAGFDSYIVCRPGDNDCPLPAEEVKWVGYDGSEVIAHRAYKAYLSGRGKAHLKVQGWLDDHPERGVGLVLWGIGNHGGGPSRIDLTNLQELKEQTESFELVHSTPEAYFAELRGSGVELPRHEGDLNAWAVGCYTSQIRIKQKHRQLENELYMTEKMMTHAALACGVSYPAAAITEAQQDLMLAQFHDILPGSSVLPVEEYGLRLMDHGREILARLRARAFFALTAGQRKAEEGEVPVFLYNPHPYKVSGVFECEFQLPQSSKGQYANIAAHRNGVAIPCQVEKELSALYIDWRKKVVVHAELEPGQMTRIDCTVQFLPEKPKPVLQETDGMLQFRSERLAVTINAATGLMDELVIDGVSYVQPGALQPIVMDDSDDAWGSQVQRFNRRVGAFKLMSKTRGARMSGVRGKPIPSVRVIEDGEVRTVIQAVMEYGSSTLVQTYKLPKIGTDIQVDVVVNWNEPRRMLKLAVPTVWRDAKCLGQVAYGVAELPVSGRENVAQKWVAAVSGGVDGAGVVDGVSGFRGVTGDAHGYALTVVNDGTYGSDMSDGELRLTLLRSPGYSALPGGKMKHTMPNDRYSSRIDQGERRFTFWLSGGTASDRLRSMDREAMVRGEKPYVLSYFPSGAGVEPQSLVRVSGDSVQVTAIKQAEQGNDEYIVRLFEPSGTPCEVELELPVVGVRTLIQLGAFEVKTLRVNAAEKTIVDETLMESM